MFSFVYDPEVFARLGLPDADEIPLKAAIVADLARCLRVAGISLADAAALLRLPQSDLAVILCGKLQHFRVNELRQWRDCVRGLSKSPNAD